MGKEWHRSGKTSKRSGGHDLADRDTTNTTGCMCAVFQLFDFPQFQFASNLQHSETQTSFKLISTTHTSTATTVLELPEEPSIPKGAEAPRNSLKSEEGTSLIDDEEVLESFNYIQMGINHIKTSCGNGGNYTPSRSSAKSMPGLSPATEFSSDTSSNSPGTRTPSLVARLMGLDLLPETTNSPTHNFTSPPTITNKYRSLSTKPYSQANPLRPRTQTLQNKARHLMDVSDNNSGTRSLPETPRISSARRSDVDIHHHRLSLQINRENATDDLDLSRLSSLRRRNLKSDRQHQNQENYESSTKSPGYYARQIVKQVKESVTRKAGMDITNTTPRKYDQHNNHAMPKRSSLLSKGLSKLEEQATTSTTSRGYTNKHVHSSSTVVSSSSCSPRLRTTSSSSTASNKDQSFQVSKPTLIYSSLALTTVKAKPEQQVKGKRNKASGGGGGDRKMMVQKIMQEETFVFGPTKKTDQTNYRRANINIPDKIKCKKTPLSNNLLSLNVVPTLLSVKKATKDVDDQLILPHKAQLRDYHW